MRGLLEFELSDIVTRSLRLRLLAHSRRRFIAEAHARTMQLIAAEILSSELPCEVLAALTALGDEKEIGLVIHGCPLPDAVPPSPVATGITDDAAVLILDLTILGLLGLAGISPVAYAYENLGRLFRNVVPLQNSHGVQSSHGDAELLPHCDNYRGDFEHEVIGGTSSFIPKYLAFGGIVNADETGQTVPTNLLPVSSLLALLDEHTKVELAKTNFTLNPVASNGGLKREAVSLLSQHRAGKAPSQYLRYNGNRNQITALTSDAQLALDALHAAVITASATDLIAVNVRPGTFFCFSNVLALHSRPSFKPSPFPERARWLRRIFGTQSPEAVAYVDREFAPFLSR